MHAAPGSVALTVWGGTTPGVAMPGSDEGDTMRASRGQASARATPAADGMHAAPGSVALTVWGGTTPGVAMPGSYEGDTMRALRGRASARATPDRKSVV